MFKSLNFFKLSLLTLFIAGPMATSALAEELPSDREALGPSARTPSEDAPLLLPPYEAPSPDAGNRGWASTDAATIQREAHLRRVAGAYGAAGSLTGLSVTFLLIAQGQVDPDNKRAWQYAAMTTGGVAAVAMIAGTVLWATTPPAPGRPRLALGARGSLTLAFDFH